MDSINDNSEIQSKAQSSINQTGTRKMYVVNNEPSMLLSDIDKIIEYFENF